MSKVLKDWKLLFLACLPAGFQLELTDEKNLLEMESRIKKKAIILGESLKEACGIRI